MLCYTGALHCPAMQHNHTTSCCTCAGSLRCAAVLQRSAPGPVDRARAGFNELMTLRRLTDLARLYSLATRIHALDPLKAAFRAYIKSTGLALILDEEKVAPCPYVAACRLLPRLGLGYGHQVYGPGAHPGRGEGPAARSCRGVLAAAPLGLGFGEPPGLLHRRAGRELARAWRVRGSCRVLVQGLASSQTGSEPCTCTG